MFSKNTKIFLFLALPLIFGFYGFMVGKKNWPPYYLLKSIAHKTFQSDSTKIILKQVALDQSINFTETTLLPLSFKELSFGSSNSETSTSSGAIRVFRGYIFILNKHREIFISDIEFNQTTSFKIKELDDNNSFFYDKYKKDLRIHDLLIKEVNGKIQLLISHEKYHPNVSKNSLNISYVELGNNFNSTKGPWMSVHEGSKLKYPDYAYSSGGGQLADYDDDSFLVANGDYNLDGWMNEVGSIPPSQDMSLSLGKIIKINFLTSAEQIISYGHRNPQGLSVSKKGRILQAEHGPNGGDEINVIDTNNLLNYGWPYQSLGIQYLDFSAPVSGVPGSHLGYNLPLFSFVPSIGISEITEIEEFDERWNGDILAASLKSRSLYRLRLEGNKVLYSEPIWVGQRIRDVKQSGSKIFLWLDNQKLRVYSTKLDFLNSSGRHANQTELNTLLSNCLQCHQFTPSNPNHPAPTLSGLYDRKIASDEGYKFYSNTLKASNTNWTSDTLKSFIMNPQNKFPGSSMPASSKRYTESELNQIVELLGNYSINSIN